MYLRNFLCILALASAPSFANVIELPTGTLSVPVLSDTGVSFVYSGTLTQNDFIDLIQTGNPCLQSPAAYCTNGAGVVTTAGSSPVGAATNFSGTFNGTSATWVFGSLLIEISGQGTEQVFPTNAGNGLGSSTPPLSLATAESLSSLGFGAFSITNPTITFALADTLYSDNSGSLTLTQAPEPSTILLVASMILGFAWFRRRYCSR
jgi:hypothetical protein